MTRIIIADNPLNEISVAKELLPPSLDAVIARHGSPEFQRRARRCRLPGRLRRRHDG